MIHISTRHENLAGQMSPIVKK